MKVSNDNRPVHLLDINLDKLQELQQEQRKIHCIQLQFISVTSTSHWIVTAILIVFIVILSISVYYMYKRAKREAEGQTSIHNATHGHTSRTNISRPMMPPAPWSFLRREELHGPISHYKYYLHYISCIS